jgi:hypothetical protein
MNLSPILPTLAVALGEERGGYEFVAYFAHPCGRPRGGAAARISSAIKQTL